MNDDAVGGSAPQGDPLDQALAAVESLRRAAEQLGKQAAAEHSVRSPDGSVEATAVRGRVVRVVLDMSLVRAGHGVDRVTLQQQTLQAARGALGRAAVPQPVRHDVAAPAVAGLSGRQVAEFAARAFVGADPDQAVSATVAGTGELVDLQIAETATRGYALEAVGGRVVSAVATAQAEFEAARRDVFGLKDLDTDLDAKVEAFDKRVDGLLGQMSTVNSALTDRMAELQELYNKRVR